MLRPIDYRCENCGKKWEDWDSHVADKMCPSCGSVDVVPETWKKNGHRVFVNDPKGGTK
jgi:rRNA maturation endonuclease Nob1